MSLAKPYEGPYRVPRAKIFESAHVHGEKFGTKGSITFNEWDVIGEAIKKYEIKSVLEFGSGFSTDRFVMAGLRVISMETDRNWAKAVRKQVPGATIVLWDNVNMPDNPEIFDLAFVDGVWPRLEQLRQAMLRAPRLFIHDVDRQEELDLIQGHITGWEAANWQNIPEFTKERVAFFEKTGD